MAVREKGRAAGSPCSSQVCPKHFVFFDIETGTQRFEVKAGPNGELPIDQAASLMAIHCLVRGRTPQDFGIVVAPKEDLLERLLPVATRLVEACSESRSSLSLSQRQQQVLRALLQDASNKEIAAKLNVSVRTVKFHVSTLFEKFQVNSRFSLMRKAADILLPDSPAQSDSTAADSARLLAINNRRVPARSLLHPQVLRVMPERQRASR